ncbi:MAG TPA: 16S rRNA (cytidine(1402)-2'-O)-methyltransferase [Gemmatimonadaceae bacterium]
MNSSPAAGRLYVVSTPIGNLGDFSFRAIEVLRGVALILAEDTRHSRTLLDRYEIRTSVAPYHEHNEAKTTPGLVARLQAGEDLALISDAGTPVLSDPGARLIAAAIDAGIAVTPIPGASALLSALVASGIDAERFTFYGFLPRKGRERAAALAELVTLPHTAVVYEAPTRLASTLAELEERGAGEKKAAVAREMTKQYEEIRRGTVSALRAYYSDMPPRGEVVLVLEGAGARVVDESDVRERARALAAEGRSARDVVAQLVAELGVSRNKAYAIVEEEKSA